MLGQWDLDSSWTKPKKKWIGGSKNLKPYYHIIFMTEHPLHRKTAIPWCAEYLTENEPTPYAFVHETMHVFSRAVRNRRRPQGVTWVNDNELIMNNKTINLEAFRSFLHFQIQSLQDFLNEKVLFGFDLGELGIFINFHELGGHGDFTTIGHNPLLVGLEGNTDSEKFLNTLVEKGEVVSFKDSKLVWDMERAQL